MRKPIIGIVGGIGSGKSRAAAIFGELGGQVIDSDRINHEILARPEIAEQLHQWWGDAVLGPDGLVNRAAVAQIVFEDADRKKRLESLVYPLIAQRREDMISDGLQDPTVRAFILDSPLLFESHLDRLCDSVVFIDSSEDNRLQRVSEARGWDLAKLRQREQWQMPLDQKRSRSEYRIRNDGTLAELRSRIERVFRRIIATYASTP